MTIDDFKKEKIQAMKDHNQDAVSALNLVITKLMALIIEKRSKGEELVDADVVSIINKAEKELIEEMEGFKKAGREETVASLEKQIATVHKYLPQLMSEDEIKEVINSLEDKSVPSVMKHFKANYAGKCDMKLVNQVLAQFK